MSVSHARARTPQSANRPRHLRGAPSRLSNAVGVLLVIVLGVYAHARLSNIAAEAAADPGPIAVTPAATPLANQPTDVVQGCEGATPCFQATSCAEANYFLQNCPGAQIDFDRNRLP